MQRVPALSDWKGDPNRLSVFSSFSLYTKLYNLIISARFFDFYELQSCIGSIIGRSPVGTICL